MKLFNSLSQKIEDFEPQGELVTLYVCGITPYDTTHLGHAFTYTSVDILIRFLEYLGHRVRYVQNVTDIDDDILRRADEEGEDWLRLGNRWTVHFIDDMVSLNVRPPDVYPRATDVIEDIINAVNSLLDAGMAYESHGSVYFSIDKWDGYGQLCRLPYEEMLPIANERGNKPDDPNKKDPLDFVLWQAQAPGEPAWESPWGPGRPGWHIECSTMAQRYIGETIDIHSGGADLLYPHHESEIAQIESMPNRDRFTRFWLHVAMVYYEGEKMSKSLGNLVMARDLLRDWSPDALRLFLGSFNYRQTWSFNPQRLEDIATIAAQLRGAVTVHRGNGPQLEDSTFRLDFTRAMEQDLDTPTAIKVMGELAAEIVHLADEGWDVGPAQNSLRQMCQVFGLRLDASGPETGVVTGWERHKARFV